MRHGFLSLLLCTVLMSAQAQNAPKPPAETPLLLRHVNVVNVSDGTIQSDRSVLIANGRIAAIQAGNAPAFGKPREVEANGKYLIPALWDMHVHGTTVPSFVSFYVVNGVLGVRDMYGAIPEIQSLRAQMKKGDVETIRIVAAGRIVDGPKPIWPGSVAVKNAAEGRAAVTTIRKEGSEFIKVYELLPRDAYFAIVEEAKRQKLDFAGHVTIHVSALEATRAGQKSIEHLSNLLLACSSEESAIRQELIAVREKPGPDTPARLRRVSERILATYDETKARTLFSEFAKNGTWQCPTLVVNRAIANLDDPKFVADPRLGYFPAWLKQAWDPKNDFRLKLRTAEDYALSRKSYLKQIELVKAMRKANVGFLAGTDVMNPYCFPGFSLHDELALLVDAGLTPLEALQAATLNPARYLKLDDKLGTVAPGKIADLVLLEANPLEDIHNTTKIYAVIQEGRLRDNTALKALRDKAAASGKSAARLSILNGFVPQIHTDEPR